METQNPQPDQGSHIVRPDRVGFIVIVVAFVALAQLLYFTYEQRQHTQCQANVNSAFLDTIKQRSSLNDARDESFETLIADVTKATTQDDVTKAFASFQVRKQSIQKLRDSFSYPDIQDACR